MRAEPPQLHASNRSRRAWLRAWVGQLLLAVVVVFGAVSAASLAGASLREGEGEGEYESVELGEDAELETVGVDGRLSRRDCSGRGRGAGQVLLRPPARLAARHGQPTLVSWWRPRRIPPPLDEDA